MLLVISSVMIVAVSYAWVTLSSSPTVSGIQVGISGGRTILLAPDIVKTVTDGGSETSVHYPGSFSDRLTLSRFETYDYLETLNGISPVSTADGINWILPEYDPSTGAIKDISEFTVDNTLASANASGDDAGGYVYLDFWVVSPGTDYELRVSMDKIAGTGSFLIEHPKVVSEEAALSGFSMIPSGDRVGSIARVGFLVNRSTADTETMLEYSRSPEYQSAYRSINGVYPEKGETVADPSEYKFTIYEPNGISHPQSGADEGKYIITEPLTYDADIGSITTADISGILTVQKNNTWKSEDSRLHLYDILQTALVGETGLTESEAAYKLFHDYLQGQVEGYVNSAEFFSNTSVLYSIASNGVVDPGRIEQFTIGAGATDDVFITALERNTPQRIRMFIWLEGQDFDCTNTESVPASDFSVELELAGS